VFERVKDIIKVDKVRKNIRENKAVYIGTISGIAVGVIGTAVFLTMKRRGITEQQIVEMISPKVLNRMGDGNNNTMNNHNTFQTISKYGNVLGRPGEPIVDTVTGHRYESIKLGARSMGVSYDYFIRQLNAGKDVNGHTFMRLIEDNSEAA